MTFRGVALSSFSLPTRYQWSIDGIGISAVEAEVIFGRNGDGGISRDKMM